MDAPEPKPVPSESVRGKPGHAGVRKWLGRIALALWVLGIIFPMAWFAHTNHNLDLAFDRTFSPGWVHVVMHLLLFFVLGAGVVYLLRRRKGAWLEAVVVILIVAVLQEGFQLMAAGMVEPALGEVFDVGIDLVGGGAGIGVATWLVR